MRQVILQSIAGAGVIALLAIPWPLLAQEGEKKPEEKKAAAKPAQPAKLRVEIVADDSQQPVAEAEVKISLESTEREFSQTGWTKEDGVATFAEVPRGKIRLQVIKKDWETHGEFVVLKQAQQTVRVVLRKD